MNGGLIDMLGRIIGPFQVVEKGQSQGKGARWIVICLTCKTQCERSGHSLRRHAGDDETMFLRCEECGA
jgi:DNA-directed RNA polymerase subunit M/transcription elongation factor TFIIS